jgi:hypothetical protein
VAITWNDVAQQRDPYSSGTWEGWALEEQEHSEEGLERPSVQTASRNKPLKINRDLLLVSIFPKILFPVSVLPSSAHASYVSPQSNTTDCY